jgi:predicted MFS family arabinose efflux permease
LVSPLHHRDYRLVWIAQITSELGDWSARLALAILVLDRTNSPALSAFSFTVSVLPSIGLGPYLSAFGDRYPRRTVLVATDVVRAVLYGAMALPVPTWSLFPLLFVAATATPPFEAVRSALLPALVPRDAYPSAVALSGVTIQTALFAGYALGGGLVSLLGARGALASNALTFLISAGSLSALRAGRERSAIAETARQSLGNGLRFVISDLLVRRTAILLCVVAGAAVIPETLAVVYAEDVLGQGAGTAGVLAAAVPIGTIVVVSLFHVDPHGSQPLRPIAVVAGLSSAVAGATFVADTGLPWAVVNFVLVGCVFGAVVPANAVLGVRIPDRFRAASMGLLQAALTAAQGLGAAIGGVAAQFGGARSSCVAALVFVVLAVVPALFSRPHGAVATASLREELRDS